MARPCSRARAGAHRIAAARAGHSTIPGRPGRDGLRHPSPELAELLDAVGERESEGHAVVWRICIAPVRHALDTGYDAEQLLDHLTAVARGGQLPQPLEYLIKGCRAHPWADVEFSRPFAAFAPRTRPC
ncbi:helicase-associated domain-containing protein [Nocardia brasiliensis]|uniref:helicase-associated domain-containing protein n=1 Tax=Nocardia brasiliensis TaxID=37326 RepID=UPI003D77AB80